MSALPEGYLRGFSIVVAHDESLGIGKNDTIPWHIPEDMQRFRERTTEVKADGYKPAVIMGMNTWYSLNCKALPNRDNIVLSRKQKELPLAELYNDFQHAVHALCRFAKIGNIFVIGGGQVYRMALEHPALTYLYVTEVRGSHGCDTFMTEYRDDRFDLVEASPWRQASKGEKSFRFVTYKKKSGGQAC